MGSSGATISKNHKCGRGAELEESEPSLALHDEKRVKITSQSGPPGSSFGIVAKGPVPQTIVSRKQHVNDLPTLPELPSDMVPAEVIWSTGFVASHPQLLTKSLVKLLTNQEDTTLFYLFATELIFLGHWRRSNDQIFLMKDSLKLANHPDCPSVIKELKPLLKFAELFTKHYLPVLYQFHWCQRQYLNSHKWKLRNNPQDYQSNTKLSSSKFEELNTSFMGVFCSLGIGHNSNRSKKAHKDNHNYQFGYSFVIPLGDFTVQYAELGIEVEANAGDVIAVNYALKLGDIEGS
ncbi:hypothetical protein BDR26DRAFT_1011676 [Obelidium mucronatum]|nr:hypothetical protein BDR26DRAFT_1011676 [Obelidium mucronatum]